MNRRCRVRRAALFLLLLPAAPAAVLAAAGGKAAAAGARDPWLVALIGHLAWPAAALLIAILFRRPLAAFVASLGGRISKLSLGGLSLELTAAAPAGATPLLDNLHNALSGAEVYDSAHLMQDEIALTQPADFAVIDLGDGEEWLTSRLYVAAIMLARMRGVKAFVLVASVGGASRQFVAVAGVTALRWALARRSPWLEGAWLAAVAKEFPQGSRTAIGAKVIETDHGGFDTHRARQITSTFIDSLQPQPPDAPPAGQPPALGPDWLEFKPGRWERAEWVTAQLLTALLPRAAFRAWAFERPHAPRGHQTRIVIRRGGDFVAMVDDDRQFLRLIDRRALLEAVAGAAVEPPPA